MKLEIAAFPVKEVLLSQETRYSKGVLRVSPSEIRNLALQDSRFVDVQVDVAQPGSEVRIINILDIIEPRHKVSGPGTVFPGVLGPPITVGTGRDHALKGMALVTTSEPAPGEAVHWRDGIIDMWGAGARYTPYSNTLNLVVQLKGRRDLSAEERRDIDRIDVLDGSTYAQRYNRAARVTGFRIADYLASVTREMGPSGAETFELAPPTVPLPRVAYVCQVHRDRWLYGERMGWQPTLLHPNEAIDGAIFSSFMGPASSRDCTYVYQNSPVILDLYRRHGEDIDFIGMLVWFYGPLSVMEKERIGGFATKLLRMRKADGAVLTWIGDGQSGVDVMMLCQKLEWAGIKTALLSPEMARTPEDPGFVHYVPEADAIVSTGNFEVPVFLERPKTVLGGSTLSVPALDASAALSLTVRYMYGSVSPQGLGKLCGTSY